MLLGLNSLGMVRQVGSPPWGTQSPTSKSIMASLLMLIHLFTCTSLRAFRPSGGFERTGRLTLAGLVKTPVENGSYRRSWTPVHRQAAFPLTASVKPIRRQVSVGRDAVLDRSKPRCSLENLDHDPSLWFSERLATPSYCLTLSVLLLAFKKRQHRLLLNLLDSIESKGSSRQHCNHLMLFKYSFFSEYIFVTLVDICHFCSHSFGTLELPTEKMQIK